MKIARGAKHGSDLTLYVHYFLLNMEAVTESRMRMVSKDKLSGIEEGTV